LKRLLEDIEQNRVDIIVVYKVDRLTRALSDFARMVDIFDANDVSFVSVTQQFNTTTSMGRLTLNVLLSFAQFEREITGERIRDKIAASKKKGMWMGGYVPLGYDAIDRKLIVNEAEAVTVRTLFALYLENGNARTVAAVARQQGLRTKVRRKEDETSTGGIPFGRGHIYQILSNTLYVGDIRHKENVYPGQHDAIIDRELWEAVQRQLATNRVKHRNGTHAKEPSLLAGLLFDSEGNRYTPSHAVKSGRRYRYYVERSLITDRSNGNTRGKRIAADEIEGVVVSSVADFLKRPDRLLTAIDTDRVAPNHFERAVTVAKRAADELASDDPSRRREIIAELVGRVAIGEGNVRIDLLKEEIASLTGLPFSDGSDQICSIDVPVQLRLRGVELKLVMENGDTYRQRRPDPALIRVVARAHDWWGRLLSGDAASAEDIAREENITRRYVNQVMPLAFLSPEITKSLLDGTQPVVLTAKTLSKGPVIPVLWAAQLQSLGFDTR